MAWAASASTAVPTVPGNARWIGVESHRKDIRIPKRDDAALIRSGPLCGAYETEWDAISISYVFVRMFSPITRHSSRSRRTMMVHFLASDEKYRDLIYDDHDRSYRTAQGHPIGDYRFGRTQGKRAPVNARIASVLVALLRSAVSSLVTFLGPSWDGPARRYRPEDHDMRGPGAEMARKACSGRACAGNR